MATIEPCETYVDQAIMSVTTYGAICVEPAAVQNEFVFTLPTAGSWFKDNWYVIFVVALVVAFSIIAISLQAIRWWRRLQHRHERAERDKRVDGMWRMVGASFRVRSSSSAAKVSRPARGIGPSMKSATTTSSSTSSSSENDSPSDSPNNSDVEETDRSAR